MGKKYQQSMPEDKRRYPRLSSKIDVRWRRIDLPEETRSYIVGLAENYSFGGVFLVTDEPLTKGSVVELGFTVPDGAPLFARAVVRWIQRLKKPTGAGLQFIEFNGIGDRDFRSLMEMIFSS
jgi:hypothetical protein